MKNNVKNLIEFIDHSPSCFHVIENARKQFLEHGFTELEEKEYWDLEEGKSYFVTRNGSSMIAFHLPKKDFKGFTSWQATVILQHTGSKNSPRCQLRNIIRN